MLSALVTFSRQEDKDKETKKIVNNHPKIIFSKTQWVHLVSSRPKNDFLIFLIPDFCSFGLFSLALLGQLTVRSRVAAYL